MHKIHINLNSGLSIGIIKYPVDKRGIKKHFKNIKYVKVFLSDNFAFGNFFISSYY